MGDERLFSMGHFFNLAKKALFNVASDEEIRLVVRGTAINAAEMSQRFFRLQKVQDAIGDGMEVTIQVVRVPRTARQPSTLEANRSMREYVG